MSDTGYEYGSPDLIPGPLDWSLPESPLSGIGALPGFDSPGPSLDPNLPKNLQSLSRKWAEISPIVAGLGDPTLTNSLLDLDRKRITKGQMPLTKKQTAQAAMAIQQGETVTKGKDRNPWDLHKNIVRDLKNIVTVIPKLPSALAEEVLSAPQAPGIVGKALARGDIAGALEAPGVRMIPGAYTLANAARGDWKEALSHPVMTALDVAPAVGKLKPVAGPALAETRVGAAAKATKQVLSDSFEGTPGSRVLRRIGVGKPADLPGGNVRDALARPKATREQTLAVILDIDKAMPDLQFGDAALNEKVAPIVREGQSLAREIPDDAAREAFTRKLEAGTPQAWASMSDQELTWAARARDITDRYATAARDHYGELQDVEIGGIKEWFPTAAADRILATRGSAARARTFADLRAMIETPAESPLQALETARDIAMKPTAQKAPMGLKGTKARASEVRTGALSKQTKAAQMQMALHAADLAGYDTLPIRRLLNKKGVDPSAPGIIAEIEGAIDNLKNTPASHPHIDDAIAKVTAAPRATDAGGYAAVIDGNPRIPKTPGAHVLPLSDGGHVTVIRNAKGALEGYMLTTDDAINTFESLSKRKGVGQQLLDEAQASGQDVPSLLANSDFTDAGRKAALRWLETQQPKAPFRRGAMVAVEDMLKVTGARKSDWGKMGELHHALNMGDWVNARRFIKDINSNKRATLPEADAWLETLDRLVEQKKMLQKTSRMTEKRALRFESTHAEVLKDNAPARFGGQIEDRARTKLTNEAVRRHEENFATPATPAEVESLSKLVLERRFREAGLTDGDMLDAVSDISKTWQKMRDAEGVDPVFVHRVGDKGVNAIRYPRIGEIPVNPSSFKARELNLTPYKHDISVAITHQGLEFLAREASEELVTTVSQSAGKSLAQLDEMYAPQVEAQTARQSLKDYQEVREDLIRKRWVPFDPVAHGFGYQGKKALQLAEDATYIPRYMAEAIADYQGSSRLTRLTAPFDKLMNVYRTALLPLSPRWQVNNTFGGAIMVGARTSPSVIGDGIEAWKMMKNPELMPERFRRIIDIHGGQEANFLREMNYYAQRTNGRITQAILDGTPGAVTTAKNAFTGVVEKSYRMNTWMDNLYRVTSLLYGERTALKKAAKLGDDIPLEQATAAGLELMHKIMPEWTAMTGLERSVLRSVFPFYAFMGHMIRYVWNYPVDHPYRAAILGGFTRAELEDMGDAYPERMLGIFRFGHQDANGNQHAFDPGAMNPFRDVPDFFTTLGWASAFNPMLTTVAEQLGLSDGSREAYPELEFDPESGRMVAKQHGLIGSFIANTLPQTQLIGMLTGTSGEFRRMLRENPDAARARFYAVGGIPLPFKSINPNQIIASTELAHQDDQARARRAAMESGDYSEALAYPGLEGLFTKLQQLPAAELAPYESDPARVAAAVAQVQQGMPTAADQVQAVAVRRAHAGGI